MTGDEEKMSKAQRLAIAAAVAPALRSNKPSRRIARIDAVGEVVGYISHIELVRILLAKKKIEIEVSEGVRPKETICEGGCGRILKVSQKGGAWAKRCSECKRLYDYDMVDARMTEEACKAREARGPIPDKIKCMDCGRTTPVSYKSTKIPKRCSDCRYEYRCQRDSAAAKARREAAKKDKPV